MKKVHKEDYKALNECFEFTRERLKVQKQENTYNIKPEEEKRLLDLDYIDWNENSKNLFHKDHIITKSGNEYFLSLKEIDYKDWWKYGIIFSLLISGLALLKAFGVI